MANFARREALRGVAEETFDLLAEVLTSQQWVEMLNVSLRRAAAKGNTGLAQKLARAGAEIGGELHEAVWHGHDGFVNYLLDNGESIADTTKGGDTPLHFAARAGNTEMVQLLLLKGANKDALNDCEGTPLFLAALLGHVAASLALMSAGADISIRCAESKTSVVHAAAQGGHADILRAVIERGANVNAVNTEQHTPLLAAVEANKAKAIDVLVEAGANIEARDGEGLTPLHFAASEASLEAVLTLLEHSANANAQDKYQETPLHAAARYAGTQGAAEMVDSLLRSGADETILNDRGYAAAGVIGVLFEDDEDRLEEDVDRVRQLLVNAPADRAWRRRGYLVLCRAHPDRVPRADATRTEAAVKERTAGGWCRRVLKLREEDVFRTIVGYL